MKSKAEESKHEKFVRLAEARTNKIIDTLQLLGNCANTSSYYKRVIFIDRSPAVCYTVWDAVDW